jgi:cysteinyl-tRNA synthetase
VLGLDLDRVWDEPATAEGDETGLPAGADELLTRRAAARDARDWPTADRLRSELAALGVDVVDSREGQVATGPRR